MLTEKCKVAMFPTIEDFERIYINNVYNIQREYEMVKWYTNENKHTYQVKLYGDILATGNLDNYKEEESFFESIGGCILIGGCDEDSNNIKEVYRTNIYKDSGTYTYEDISFTVSYIGFNNCIENSTCDSDENIEVGLTVNNGFEQKEMKVITGERYKWIVDTDNYIFAKINNGSLVVGLAEYNGRWNIYDN